MIKLIFLLKRKAGLSPEQFRAHYEDSHVKLAQLYFGHLLQGYRRNYPSSATLIATGATAQFGYDAIAEMWLEDQTTLERMIAIIRDPEISRVLVSDEEEFLDREATLMLVCDEVDTGTKE